MNHIFLKWIIFLCSHDLIENDLYDGVGNGTTESLDIFLVFRSFDVFIVTRVISPRLVMPFGSVLEFGVVSGCFLRVSVSRIPQFCDPLFLCAARSQSSVPGWKNIHGVFGSNYAEVWSFQRFRGLMLVSVPNSVNLHCWLRFLKRVQDEKCWSFRVKVRSISKIFEMIKVHNF